MPPFTRIRRFLIAQCGLLGALTCFGCSTTVESTFSGEQYLRAAHAALLDAEQAAPTGACVVVPVGIRSLNGRGWFYLDLAVSEPTTVDNPFETLCTVMAALQHVSPPEPIAIVGDGLGTGVVVTRKRPRQRAPAYTYIPAPDTVSISFNYQGARLRSLHPIRLQDDIRRLSYGDTGSCALSQPLLKAWEDINALSISESASVSVVQGRITHNDIERVRAALGYIPGHTKVHSPPDNHKDE